ncbi:MAG: PEGA domain-containing protein [Deltaproteobacteria bacterium]|nr:PEGA domain-containing protein [Deltaproteobacteria bacterium]
MRALVLGLLVWMSATAQADVGVVVIGEATMQPQLAAQLEGWLRQHGHQLVAAPLPPDAINTMIDCFVLEDENCARLVIKKRAKAQAVVFARVDLQAGATDSERTVTLTAYWFDKTRDAIAERRFCERCTDLSLRSTADELMTALTSSTKQDTGHLKLTSSPIGARVLVDGKPVGVTPLEYDLAAGPHQIKVERDGREELRDVTIRTGETTVVDIAVARRGGRRMLPLALIGGGGALLVTGVLLVALDEDVPSASGEQPEFYRNTAAAGVGLMVVGGLVTGLGAYFMLTSGSSSAPVAAIASDSAYVGWAGRF